MVLATVAEAQPNARVVLLKDYDANGFVFYTNTQSAKGQELAANPKASLLFHWMPLQYQVRIQGAVAPVSDAEADAYFQTRERGKQIGAWASLQSQTLASHEALFARFDEYEAKFEGADVPRPPHWSGYRLAPARIEFWSQGDYRLHERHVFTRSASGWDAVRLYP